MGKTSLRRVWTVTELLVSLIDLLQRRPAGQWVDDRVVTRAACRTRAAQGVEVGVCVSFGRARQSRADGCSAILVLAPVVLVVLVVTSAHADIPADANAAALLGHHTAKGSAFRETGEFLRGEHDERLGFHLQAVRDVSVARRVFRDILILVVVLGVLQFLVQAEAEPVFAFVPHREIGEDEVTRRIGPFQIDHAGDRGAGQYGQAVLVLRHASIGDGTGLLQSRKQEVVCVHVEGDVIFGALALENLQLDDGWRIHGSTVGRGWGEVSRMVIKVRTGETHTWHQHRTLGHVRVVARRSYNT